MFKISRLLDSRDPWQSEQSSSLPRTGVTAPEVVIHAILKQLRKEEFFFTCFFTVHDEFATYFAVTGVVAISLTY